MNLHLSKNEMCSDFKQFILEIYKVDINKIERNLYFDINNKIYTITDDFRPFDSSIGQIKFHISDFHNWIRYKKIKNIQNKFVLLK